MGKHIITGTTMLFFDRSETVRGLMIEGGLGGRFLSGVVRCFKRDYNEIGESTERKQTKQEREIETFYNQYTNYTIQQAPQGWTNDLTNTWTASNQWESTYNIWRLLTGENQER